MKIKNIKYVALAAVFGMGATSCDDFLDRPTEDNYNQSNFYQNDTQCVQGVNFCITLHGMISSVVSLKWVK